MTQSHVKKNNKNDNAAARLYSGVGQEGGDGVKQSGFV